MGFDFTTDSGIATLENWVKTRSYIDGYSPSQADVVVFKALQISPAPARYPHASRWTRHIASFKDEFSHLPGEAKAYTAYGPTITTNAAEEEDDIDLFGSDDEEEDAETVRIREERLAEYNKKKAGKVRPAAKSVVTMDVKPWDDETDMNQLEANVRAIEKDGLVWGASKFAVIGYGIKKLQITLVVEDDKISLDELQQTIEEDEDHVQSTDIQAMQKL